jgi:hypothetical protein
VVQFGKVNIWLCLSGKSLSFGDVSPKKNFDHTPHPHDIRSDIVRGYEGWQEWTFDDFLKVLKKWERY